MARPRCWQVDAIDVPVRPMRPSFAAIRDCSCICTEDGKAGHYKMGKLSFAADLSNQMLTGIATGCDMCLGTVAGRLASLHGDMVRQR